MDNIDDAFRKTMDELFGNKGKNSICSTCKHFRDGKFCAKKKSFAGFATKLADCEEWEVCNG